MQPQAHHVPLDVLGLNTCFLPANFLVSRLADSWPHMAFPIFIFVHAGSGRSTYNKGVFCALVGYVILYSAH